MICLITILKAFNKKGQMESNDSRGRGDRSPRGWSYNRGQTSIVWPLLYVWCTTDLLKIFLINYKPKTGPRIF